ncbi:MAG: branched-chain amino acid ABC transporter permease [Candidatus Hodarchaeales archaeon]|jgi:branched-chain amino acid transport system permease protein
MDWKERIEDFWEDLKDHIYYILFVGILLVFPFLIAAPAADLPEPFSILNSIYNGSELPVLSEIYGLARDEELFGTNTYVVSILTLCLIWGIFAASWDLLSGYTGQVSFGHALFWGVAAYFSFWFASGLSVGPDFQDLLGDEVVIEPLLALLFGATVAALLALCIGLIALRVKGPYLALVTLVIPLIVHDLPTLFRIFDVGLEGELFGFEYSLILFQEVNSGGNFGNANIPAIIPSSGNAELDALNFYLFCLLVFFAAVALMMAVAFSRFGLAFQSVREDEDAAESLGINVSFYKILAFTLSAFFAGLAGGLYAQWLNFTGPSFFDSTFSFSVIIFVVIGGVGSITGGVIGAFLMTILVNLFLEDVFHGVHALDILAFGLLLIVTLRYMRFGLVRAARDQKKAIVIGLMFALFWTIITNIDMLDFLKIEKIGTFAVLLIMLFVSLPAIPVFWISEFIGLPLLEEILKFTTPDFAGFSKSSLIKAKFLIYATVGIPWAYYLPKIFKKVRLRFWGVWPSVGRYEPD